MSLGECERKELQETKQQTSATNHTTEINRKPTRITHNAGRQIELRHRSPSHTTLSKDVKNQKIALKNQNRLEKEITKQKASCYEIQSTMSLTIQDVSARDILQKFSTTWFQYYTDIIKHCFFSTQCFGDTRLNTKKKNNHMGISENYMHFSKNR